ncbi:hypothetical protein P3T76_011060 [Phytophthora citrophthora]|uniref:Uncharacterized protein n=1 Tax=Phytophthora citrophthora TaxID=4793 RepID=A0AAD9G9Q1_9STRA|nr:hypothetical protein P3T76_011060 [Phytophthora citrophthora]
MDDEPMGDWQPGDKGDDLQDDEPLEVNAFAEQFELVCTDETGNELAGVFQELTDALEAGRLGARDAVTAAVQIRRRHIQTRRRRLRRRHRRELSRVRSWYHRRREEPPGEVVERVRGLQLAEIAEVATRTREVNRRRILWGHLIHAAQQLLL